MEVLKEVKKYDVILTHPQSYGQKALKQRNFLLAL